MKKILLLCVLVIFSCSDELVLPYPCLEDCGTEFIIDPLVSPGAYLDNNGYWHITHQGYNYFTIKGNISELHPDYIVNGVPLLETIFDSNYWVWINNITFTVPLYSALGYFTGGGFTNPIPIGNLTYTIEDMANNFPPLNIVGYSYYPGSTIEELGTKSNYNYTPQQQIFFDNEMVGDTAKIFIKTIFPADIEIEKQFSIIFE